MLIILLSITRLVSGAGSTMEKALPAAACADGWVIDGKAVLYDKDTLFDRINGESELYFHYGFETLVYARYENKRDPKIAIEIDVYKMGSLVDAFGIFANYRRKDDADIAVGAQGTISSSQVFFYQDRYFVRLQVTGATSAPRDAFLSCAKAVSLNLPKSTARPKELEAFAIPSVVKRSERYAAQSLLGYDFFRKGMIADAVLKNEQLQVFVVIEQSRDAARSAFDRYRSYLGTAEQKPPAIEAKAPVSLEAVDPLYGKVFAEQAGRFIIGVVRFKDGSAAKQLVGQVRALINED
jgi:hypothetical protein